MLEQVCGSCKSVMRSSTNDIKDFAAAGRVRSCPKCGTLLDWRRFTVEVRPSDDNDLLGRFSAVEATTR